MSKMATGLDRYFAKSLGGKLDWYIGVRFGFIDQNWPRFSVQYCVTVTLKSGPESIVYV